MESLGFCAQKQDEMLDFIISKLPPMSPISELEAEMTILWSGLRRPKPVDVKKVKDIVDPNDNGFFDYATFLTVMAENTKIVEKSTNRTSVDGCYKLRPRDKLKIPQKWTGFDSITYASFMQKK